MRVNALIVGSLCMISAAVAAHAEVIHYVNRGEFQGSNGFSGCGSGRLPTWLNITRAPSDQVPQREFNSFGKVDCHACTGCTNCEDYFLSGGAAVKVEPDAVPYFQRCLETYAYHTTVLRAKPSTWIGPEDSWSVHAVYSTRAGRVTIPPIVSRGVLALRLTINGRFHYGWTAGVAWAYESEPDTPIQVPCIGDYNYDQRYDTDDLIAFFHDYDRTISGRSYSNADVNNDGMTDFFDYLDFFAAWSTACGNT